MPVTLFSCQRSSVKHIGVIPVAQLVCVAVYHHYVASGNAVGFLYQHLTVFGREAAIQLVLVAATIPAATAYPSSLELMGR